MVVDWFDHGEATVNAVYFHTDETLMTSGTIRFMVDDYVCPDTSGVGVNGKGGVFNCGLVGNYLYIDCYPDLCQPNFSVTEIKIWNSPAVSVYGTPYVFAGNTASGRYSYDMDYVFKVGSYGGFAGATWPDCFVSAPGSVDHSSLNMHFAEATTVT